MISHHKIVDKEATFNTIALFEQIQFTKDQLESTKLIKYINKIYKKSPNQLLKYRLEILLNKWCEIRDFYENNRPVCESVFDAILNNDDDFFETKNIRELLHRLLKSFDKNYKVTFSSENFFCVFLYVLVFFCFIDFLLLFFCHFLSFDKKIKIIQ